MAASTKNTPGVRLQSWMPPVLAAEVRQHADSERRSVSSLIRIAVEDQLREKQGTR